MSGDAKREPVEKLTLQQQYEQALQEWEMSGEAEVWDVTVEDGIEPEDWEDPQHPAERLPDRGEP